MNKRVPTLNAVKRYISRGKTIGEICAKYGICRGTLYRRLGPDLLGLSKVGPRPIKQAKPRNLTPST